jgi:hypothetical protein
MIKLALTVATILAATSIVAQDTTPEQQAAKCAEQGGCIAITRDELIAVAQAVAEKAYRQGLRACNSNI